MIRFVPVTLPSIIDADFLPAAKRHLRIEGDHYDTEVEVAIARAIAWIEARTGRTILTTTYRLDFDKFPATCFRLPRPNLISVETIDYIDEDDAPQTLASTEYDVLTACEPGMVREAYLKEWPVGRDIVVNYTAGYGADWDSVPALAQTVILLATHHFYYNRGGDSHPEGLEDSLLLLTVGDEFTKYPS